MNEKGVSLIEMLMVVTVLGVLLVLGGEGFVAAAARNQSQTVTTELAAELRAARHLAMAKQERVRVLFYPGGSHIRTEHVDKPGDPIRVFDFDDRKVVVESLSNGPSVVFYPSGRAATPTTITLRGARQERRQLTVSLTGRVFVSKEFSGNE